MIAKFGEIPAMEGNKKLRTDKCMDGQLKTVYPPTEFAKGIKTLICNREDPDFVKRKMNAKLIVLKIMSL